jgi:hypothetical protein
LGIVLVRFTATKSETATREKVCNHGQGGNMNWKNKLLWIAGWFLSLLGFGWLYTYHFTDFQFWIGMPLAALGAYCFDLHGQKQASTPKVIEVKTR